MVGSESYDYLDRRDRENTLVTCEREYAATSRLRATVPRAPHSGVTCGAGGVETPNTTTIEASRSARVDEAATSKACRTEGRGTVGSTQWRDDARGGEALASWERSARQRKTRSRAPSRRIRARSDGRLHRVTSSRRAPARGQFVAAPTTGWHLRGSSTSRLPSELRRHPHPA